jgi:hypothetical protein
MFTLSPRAQASVMLGALVLLASCDAPSTIAPPTVRPDADAHAAVSAVSGNVSMVVHDTTSLAQYSPFALQRLAWGDVLTWVSSAPAVVQVDPLGHATALAPGNARVVVSFKKRVDTLDVTVGIPAVATVTLSAVKLSLAVAQSTTVGVQVRDALGRDIPWLPIAFAASDTAILTVDAAGAVLARAAGSAAVLASAGGVSSAAITFTVTAPPPPPPPPPRPRSRPAP